MDVIFAVTPSMDVGVICSDLSDIVDTDCVPSLTGMLADESARL